MLLYFSAFATEKRNVDQEMDLMRYKDGSGARLETASRINYKPKPRPVETHI